MIRKIALITVLGALLLSAGCVMVTPAPAPEKVAAGGEAREFTIGVANFVLGAPYFVAMSDAAEEEGAFFENVTVITTDGGGDAEKMTSDIEDLIAKGADGILINAGPIEALPAALDAIQQAGIPVVMVDRLLEGGEYNSWIGPDNYLIGVQDGQYIVDRLGGEGTMIWPRAMTWACQT